MRKQFWACALFAILEFPAAALEAQTIPPYHRPGAEGQYRSETRREAGSTFGQRDGRFYGGASQSGIAYPGYWTYNRFSTLGFGGLNWYYGPLGGYTPYIGTPYATTNYGYPDFGPYYSYVPLAPVIRQSRPYLTGDDPFDNAAVTQLAQAGSGSRLRTAARQPSPPPPSPAPQQPLQPNLKLATKPVSADTLRRSVRYQAQGDEWFSKSNYLQAYGHYKQAVSLTPGRVEPRFRMAMALAATTNYSQAVEELKRALRIDPDLPRIAGASLDDLFGADNILSKNAVLHKTAAWVKEDIRDPERLFLMGVLLHYNDDPDKAHTFFEAAFELSPNGVYAQEFLKAEDDERARRPAEEPRPNPPDENENSPLPDPPVIRPKSNRLPLRRPLGKPPAARPVEEPTPKPLAFFTGDSRRVAFSPASVPLGGGA